MHKQREEDRISGAANKPSAEDEFDSRVRESEVRTWPARATNAPHHYRNLAVGSDQRGWCLSPGENTHARFLSLTVSYWLATNCGIYYLL